MPPPCDDMTTWLSVYTEPLLTNHAEAVCCIPRSTTFAFSPAFEPALGALDGLKCIHPIGTHEAVRGRDSQGRSHSKRAAAFPADLNLFIARAVASLPGMPLDP